jgi:valyl-tRNA synthetase
MELAKAYQPQEHEDAIYQKWLDSGYFNPDNLEGEPFSVMMPPPNVTGVLHLGHALENALMDVVLRYQRLNGKKALLVPGTDHAAVATQAKVEGLLQKDGMENPREELGREALLEKIREYAENSKKTILKQIKKVGTSCDWSRLAYTFDEKRSEAVNNVFVKMYKDALIYRGYKVINWTVKGQSTCSDDELEHIDRKAKFYTFKYTKDFPITIATTRPETKLGDTAVAVNPKDDRYKEYIGQVFTIDIGAEKPLEIKVIGDENVDMEMGTGAFGVTPAHSAVDFEMYEKQKAKGDAIEIIQVIGTDGKMTKAAGKDYAGLGVIEARNKFVDYLETKFRFNSTGTAKSVYELIRAYRKLSLKDTEHQKLLKIQKL